MRDRYKIPDFLRRQPEQPSGPRERPVLFSAPMVRAILAGTKTQTRRVVKRHPSDDGNMVLVDHGDGWWPYRSADSESPVVNGGDEIPYRCPYGQPGARLWVRENGWERPQRTPKMMREGADTWAPYYFDADGYGSADAEQFKEWGFKRRPSIHMPRRFSRIDLEITAVRVERLGQISEADARQEGVESVEEFIELWKSINGKWEPEQWTWVLQFRRA